MFVGASTIFATFAFALVVPAIATTTDWNTTGDYLVNMEYLGSDYSHDMTLSQDELGNLTGNGGSPADENIYTWTIDEGVVTGDLIEFTADYTATPDATDPQTTIVVEGTIAEDGTMSGTWSDNYDDGERSGTWSTTEGTATAVPVEDPSTVTVTIDKFVQGTMATAETADDADFPMTATWNAENVGAGTGSYTLSETNTVAYQAVTVEMTVGADYTTSELVDGDTVGAVCADDKPFALEGYTVGNTHAEAAAADPSMTVPAFTNLQNDMFVIVWNRDCALPEGEIGGEVVGEDGALEVTSIEMIDTTATANGSFNDGWEYVFHITVPTSEPNLAMKFSDWLQTGDDGTIPVANNMRISSLQADNDGATVLLIAENVYSTPDLHMTEDLDLDMDGLQVEVTVEVAVPNGTSNGAYTTSYGVQSNP